MSKNSQVRWYVIANRTDAVFYADERAHKFRFRERLSNKSGHLTESELVSDRPGRSFSSSGNGAVRHAMIGKSSRHEQIAKKFALQIAASLEVARRQDRFGELVLVAEPHFLGLLRDALAPEIRSLVKHEVHREYAQGSDEEIRSRVLKAIEAEL